MTGSSLIEDPKRVLDGADKTHHQNVSKYHPSSRRDLSVQECSKHQNVPPVSKEES